MNKIKAISSFLLSVVSGLLGLIGLSGLCCTIAGGAILSFFGIASFSTFLVYNNKWFLLGALIFLILGLYSLITHRDDKKECKYCEISKKKKQSKKNKLLI